MWLWCTRNSPQVLYQSSILYSRFQLILRNWVKFSVSLQNRLHKPCCFRFAVLGMGSAFPMWLLFAFFFFLIPLSLYNHIIRVYSTSRYKKTQVRVNLSFWSLSSLSICSTKKGLFHFHLVAGKCSHVFL